MRLAGPVNLGAAKISPANIHTGEQLEPHFSKDFLGNFIQARTAEGLIKHAGLPEEKADDPFIKHKADALANTLTQDDAAKRPDSVRSNLQLILAFGKKAPWWNWKVILEGLKSLLRTTKNVEVEQEKDAYISVLSPLELAKAELEKLSQQVEELHDDDLHNKNQIDQKAREEDHRIYLSAKKYIGDAYHACLAEIESSKKSEAAAFMEGFQATSHLDPQPSLLRSRSNEQLLITEAAEESVNSITPDTSSSDNQIVSQISMPSTLTGENMVEAQSFLDALKILKTFSRKSIELKSPESGLVKKAHDFIHHDMMSEAVATGSAVAQTVVPGGAMAVNSGAVLVRSIAKGIMYSDSSFREVEYKNAFRMQLKNKIDFAIHEVEDMGLNNGTTVQAAAFSAAGMASRVINNSLVDNTAAMEGQATVIGQMQEEVKELRTVVGQLVEIAKPLVRQRTSSTISSDSGYLSSSPVITENMSAGQALRVQSTSPEAGRPTTPELLDRVATLEKALAKQTDLVSQQTELITQERERAKQEREELLAILKEKDDQQKQQFNMLLAAINNKSQAN